ncbi:hypothetical protein ASE75_13805 [Sphingomonas sp. Leaf17]|uniref:hypothetical protein n=1 Tax=Sphingomonas sp. Leaf17 TaxID=1735683 RepID=UPI0006FF7CD5|nr:hypothetical protein [Sphingomonas sp. Leaf17]KQM62698.1 hypothetical protein ASE75_13805 [Sphingomonas sp. Leaf17]
MAAQIRQGTASSSPTFSPAGWLHSLVQIGGGYALAADRKLWLVVKDCPGDELTSVMAQIVGRPDRQEAIRMMIERRQNGEVH